MLDSSFTYSSVLKIEAICSSDTLANFYQVVRRYIPQCNTLHSILLVFCYTLVDSRKFWSSAFRISLISGLCKLEAMFLMGLMTRYMIQQCCFVCSGCSRRYSDSSQRGQWFGAVSPYEQNFHELHYALEHMREPCKFLLWCCTCVMFQFCQRLPDSVKLVAYELTLHSYCC
jgi:hypothetical protein